jgi:hypothetical protein
VGDDPKRLATREIEVESRNKGFRSDKMASEGREGMDLESSTSVGCYEVESRY